MAYRASPEDLKRGLTVEAELTELVRNRLRERKSKAVVKAGPSDPRENGLYGDILVCPSDIEAPIVMLDVKAPSYVGSFSLTPFERNLSRVRWVLVRGTWGIWGVRMTDAVNCAVERTGDDGNKYFTCEPDWDRHVSIDDILDDIQRALGEL